MHPDFDLPFVFHSSLRDYAREPITIGESHASVYRLRAAGRPDLILKSQRRGPFRGLLAEAERLRWLRGRALVPEVVDFVTDATHDHLLMKALPGEDAATVELAPERLVTLLAECLRETHAIDVTSCPFHHSAADLIEQAKARLEAGEVDVDDFDPDIMGRPPEDILAEIVASSPATELSVFTHGDYCLPNVLVHDGRLSGLVDLGSAGVGDPYRDLAQVARSLLRNLGTGWLERFFDVYGLERPDQGKLRFFRLLDEFF